MSAGAGGLLDGAGANVVALGQQAQELHMGVALRALLVLVAVALIFLLPPASPLPGAPRRLPRPASEVEFAVQVLGVVLLFSGLLLLGMDMASGNLLRYGYPLSALAVVGCGFAAGYLRASAKPEPGRLEAEKVRRNTKYGIVLPVRGGQFVNVPNPFRGTLVLGGAGAGKTYSIGEPFLEQFLAKGMCGLIYDFKFPVLAAAAQKALVYVGEAAQPIRHRVINFLDMERTEKVNPLRPQDMATPAYAMEYAQTILTNLNPGGAKGGDNFFEKSAEAYLTGIIWFYRNNFPALCTIPHVVATALYEDYKHVLSMLATDPRSQMLVQSIITSVQLKAEKQTAGIIGSLQIALARLTTPEISWVLAPDEEQGEGFSLNLNDRANPTLLTIGNDPTLARTFAPVIACVLAVALKLMNQQHKHPSFVLIDEGATIYVPGLEVIPATARSNQVAMLYMTQDIAQMVDAYGKDKTQVLVSNLNNQFFGKTNSTETARLISEMIGKEDTEVVSVSAGKSTSGGKAGGGRNVSQSVSYQERQVVRTQDPFTLHQGEFIGQTVETPRSFFQGLIDRDVEPGDFPIAPMSHFREADGVVTVAIREQLKQDRTQTEQQLADLQAERQRHEDAAQQQAAARRAAERAMLHARRQAAETSPDADATAEAAHPDEQGESAQPVRQPQPAQLPDAPAKAEPKPVSPQERAQLEAVARQLAGEKRLVKQEKAEPATAKERLIEQNQERIYREVEIVINTFENLLNPTAGATKTPERPTY